MISLLLASLTTVLFGGAGYLFFSKGFGEHPRLSIGGLLLLFLLSAAGYYFAAPALIQGFWAALWLILSVMIPVLVFKRFVSEETGWKPVLLLALCGLLSFAAPFALSDPMFRAQAFAGLVGHMDQREWLQDTQPANAAHVRLVSREMAHWTATQKLGSAPNAIGSQFEVSEEGTHLQMIRGRLWWIAPLDFSGFFTWWSAQVSPGYVMVDAENPTAQPILRLNQHFRYTPEAWLNYDLHRHLWLDGCTTVGLMNTVLEIDDNERAWWVVSVFHLTIGASGRQITGVIIVDPETGSHRFYARNQIPAWVDLAIPGNVVKDNLDYHGSYHAGWWNSWTSKRNLTESGTPRFIFGTDNEPYWVSELTSTNANDQSMIGLVYTHARTGRSHLYHMTGGTESAILAAVNNAVTYRHQHGTDPMFYHVRGTMAAIVPLLGENHTFQGVAIARVDNLQQRLAQGETAVAALHEYENTLAASGNQTGGIETATQQTVLTGHVQRIAVETHASGPVYYVLLVDQPVLFSGTSDLSSELIVTQPGDEVELHFVPSPQGITALSAFDNRTLVVRP